MTNRFFAYDIREAVETLLNNGTTGFNATVTLINSERTHTAPLAREIVHTWGRNQFPFLLIEMKNSEVNYDESLLDTKIVNLTETYNMNIVGFIKSAEAARSDWVEDWIEAVIRVLHNYNSKDISWIGCTGTDREDLYQEKEQTLNMFMVSFEIRIN